MSTATMQWFFVAVGYSTVFGGIAVYTAWLMRRARSLSAKVPEEKRRFLD